MAAASWQDHVRAISFIYQFPLSLSPRIFLRGRKGKERKRERRQMSDLSVSQMGEGSREGRRKLETLMAGKCTGVGLGLDIA